MKRKANWSKRIKAVRGKEPGPGGNIREVLDEEPQTVEEVLVPACFVCPYCDTRTSSARKPFDLKDLGAKVPCSGC